MLVHSTIEASKNWSGLINRLGFGILALSVLAVYEVVPPEFLPWNSEDSIANDPRLIPWAVFVLFVSMLLGGVVVAIGTIGKWNKFGEMAKARRAHRVGQAGNTLLAEVLRDANQKYEVASGFFGLLFLTVALGLASIFFEGSPPQSSLPWNLAPDLSSAFPGVLGAIFGLLIRFSATNSIEALDTVLDEIERESSKEITEPVEP